MHLRIWLTLLLFSFPCLNIVAQQQQLLRQLISEERPSAEKYEAIDSLFRSFGNDIDEKDQILVKQEAENKLSPNFKSQ